MVKIYSLLIGLLITIPLFPQKVSVQICRSSKSACPEWQILGSDFIPVITGNDFPGLDSVSVGLEENKRYFLLVSIPDGKIADSWICRVYINSQVVLLVRSDQPAGDHFYSFVTGVKKPVAKITGGTSADISNYPWQVYLQAGNYACGGSIIAGNWIITAAHCTEDGSGNPISASAMEVIVGANNPRSGVDGKSYSVSRVIRHEKYDHQSLNNDIALLQLASTINYTNAKPIRLVSKIDSAAGAADPGVMSWVTGYGLIKPTPPTYPTSLQQVQLPVVSNSEASTVWSDIEPSDLMAGYKSGNKDACNGDSGGPLVVPVDNEYKLAGLVSWGSSNCDTYGAYTRVSQYENWINSNTGIEISYTPPVPSGDSIVCLGQSSGTYSAAAITAATAYDWVLLPSEAGTVTGSANQATINWAQGYVGAATLKLRVIKYGFPSYWSYLTIHVARYNKLLSQSNDTVICAGKPVTFNVDAEGYNLKYSWYRDGSLISARSSSPLPLNNTTTLQTGVYQCDISGSCGDNITTSVDLTVLPVTAIVTISPDTEASFGDNINLDVNAEGHNLIYQWNKDGKKIADAGLPQFVLSDVNASATGLYNVDISGTCGEVLSRNIYVYVSETNTRVIVWPAVSQSEISVAVEGDEKYNISLFSLSGKLVQDHRNCQYKTTLSVSGLPTGMYLLEIYGAGFRKTVKVIRN
jgi:secreted trypsin-like serine protease